MGRRRGTRVARRMAPRNINVSPYLSPLGEQVMAADQDAYIDDLVGGFNYSCCFERPTSSEIQRWR